MLCRLQRKTIGLNDISLMEDRPRETLNGDILPSLTTQKSRNQIGFTHIVLRIVGPYYQNGICSSIISNSQSSVLCDEDDLFL